MKYLYYFAILLFAPKAFCQQENSDEKAKIATILEDYFELEREAIHLHTNKTTYITNESIWYQGYIINRNTNKPYFTTNVFVLLLDEKGNKISEELAYANNGSFSGKFDIKNEIKSGNYYIQVYTNWMNNFKENECTIQNIKIINPKTGAKNYKKINEKTLQLFATPESGELIFGITNSVGIQIKDCRGNAPSDCEVSLQNSSGEILNIIKLNQFGYGKFEFSPSNTSYKIVAKYNNQIIEKQLPAANAVGFSLRVNNHLYKDKTIINIQTNALTFKNLKNKKLYLVISQDKKSSINEFSINQNSLETIFEIPHSELTSGTNTIRLIDSEFTEYASRLIYIYPKIEKTITLKKTANNIFDINLKGNSSYPNTILSTSILPEKSIAWDDSNNIYAGITINPYLVENLPHANYYFESINRNKIYELDLALLNQPQKKYDWNYMKSNKPVINYSFDIGLTIKGKVDLSLKNKEYHKVKLMSFKNLMLITSDINEEGEYTFENVLLPDSTAAEISIYKIPDFKEINTKLNPYVLNRNRPFYKEFKIKIPEYCNDNLEELNLDDLDIYNEEAIILNEVSVENNSDTKLRYASQFGNANLTAYKIEGYLKNRTLANFIQANGFTVINTSGELFIFSKGQYSLNASQPIPAIYIDGRQIMSFVEIEFLQMEDIDEIYLNPNAIVPGIGNFMGIIKIYTKKIKSFKKYYENDLKDVFFTEGFSMYVNFKNAEYDTVGYNVFNKLGVLDWSPRIFTDGNSDFSIKFTNYNQQKGKSIIQGMTNDGVLFQEESIIELK